MVCYGIDVHPQFQAGLNIEQVRAEGFDFMAVKVSQGTTTYAGLDWLRRGEACGLLSLGYHYLDDGNTDAQARTFAGQLAAAGVPGMVDVEAGSGDIANVRAFLTACQAHGVDVRFLYLPHWYWQQIGSPDLTGLPMLWASNYVAGSGYAAQLYNAVTPGQWAAYGGLPVGILQFTDKALVAGQTVDADAFLGTRDQLASLLGIGDDMTPEEHQMLRDCHDELYRRLETRVPNAPSPKYTDTMLGYSVNADMYGYEILAMLKTQQVAIDALAKSVAALSKPA